MRNYLLDKTYDKYLKVKPNYQYSLIFNIGKDGIHKYYYHKSYKEFKILYLMNPQLIISIVSKL